MFSQNMPSKGLPFFFLLLSIVVVGWLILNTSLPTFLGIVGIIIIGGFCIININKFTIFLLALKPLIDLTWNSYLISMGNMEINSLRFIGFLALVIWVILYLRKPPNYQIFNHNVFLLFLLWNIISLVFGYLFVSHRAIMSYFDIFIRIGDGALLYFITGYLFDDRDKRKRLIKILWISTLLPLIFSYYSFFAGSYNISMSQDTARFAGFYDDAGVAATNSMAGIIFAILYFELYLKNSVKKNLYRVAVSVTVLLHTFIIYLTISRAITIVFFVFVLLWFGVYKKKIVWVVPILILLGYGIISAIPSFQARFQTELSIITSGGLTSDSFRGFGSGRGGLWLDAIEYYKTLNPIKQALGTGVGLGDYITHQDYLAILFRNGIVGLILYLLLMSKFLVRTLKNFLAVKDPELKPLLFFAFIMVLNHLIYGISFRPMSYTTYTWYLWLILSISLNYKKTRSGPNPDYNSTSNNMDAGRNIEHQ